MAHHLDETFQSAYKNFHSTETALVRVQNDILCAIDNNESVILLLLDLSAAFDTVDHSILLSRLHDRFGVNGTAAAWFESYLSHARSLFGSIGNLRTTTKFTTTTSVDRERTGTRTSVSAGKRKLKT